MAGETEKDAEQNKDPDILEDDSVFCVQPNASVSSESQRHSSVHATTALLDGKVREHLNLDYNVLTT